MDDIDRAGDQIERENKALFENHKRRMSEKKVQIYCEICGNEIPLARRIATGGCNMCIQCASDHEFRQRNFKMRVTN